MSGELATRVEEAPIPIVRPRSIADFKAVAKEIADSGLAKFTPPQAFILMMICEAEGMHPIKALQCFDIIEGRPAMKTAAMLGFWQARGGSIDWVESGNQGAAAVFTHRTFAPKGKRVAFTKADAHQAGLLSKPI